MQEAVQGIDPGRSSLTWACLPKGGGMVPHFTLGMLLRWDVGWGLEEKVGCMGIACVLGGGGVRWDRRTRRPTVPWPRRGGGMLVGGGGGGGQGPVG